MSLRAVPAIASVTMREILRDRVLYNVLVVAIVLIVAGFASSRLSFMSPGRVILDFGLTGVQLSGFAVAVLLGAAMIPSERSRRTMMVSLSRPITFAHFVVGKFLGLAAVILLNWLLISLLTIGLVAVGSDPGFWASLHPTVEWALLLSLFQSLLAAAVAMVLSTHSTVSVSVMVSVLLYVAGTSAQTLRVLSEQADPAVAALMRGASWVIPNYDLFNLGFKVTYGLPVAPLALAGSLVYAAAAITAILTATAMLLRQSDS